MVGIALVPLAGSLRQPAGARRHRRVRRAAGADPVLAGRARRAGGGLVRRPAPGHGRCWPRLCLVAAGGRTALTFEQTRALARSRTEARTDELTTVGNRRMLDERLPGAGRRGHRRPAAAGRHRQHPAPVGDQRDPRLRVRRRHARPRSAPGCASRSATARSRPGSAAPRSRCCSRSTGTWPGPSSRCATCWPRWRVRLQVGGVEVEIELSAGVAAGPMHATRRPRPAPLCRRGAAPGQGDRVRGRGLRPGPGHRPRLRPAAAAGADRRARSTTRSSPGTSPRSSWPVVPRSSSRRSCAGCTRSTACSTRPSCDRWRRGPD